MMMAPTTEPMAMAAAAGQPTSTTVSDRPKRSTITWTAGESVVPSSELMTRFSPMKPMPTVRPARSDLPKPAPKQQPRIVRTIGIMTETPRPEMNVKKPRKASIPSSFLSNTYQDFW